MERCWKFTIHSPPGRESDDDGGQPDPTAWEFVALIERRFIHIAWARRTGCKPDAHAVATALVVSNGAARDDAITSKGTEQWRITSLETSGAKKRAQPGPNQVFFFRPSPDPS